MKKIRFYLVEFSWLGKACLFIIWLLWAIQLWGVIKQQIKEEAVYQKKRNIEQEINGNREVDILAFQKVKDAKAAGNSYSPAMYFHDLREINEKVMKYNIPAPLPHVNELLWLSHCNVVKKYFTSEDVNKARAEYLKWQNENPTPIEKYLRQGNQSAREGFKDWCIVFYLRSMVLMFFFYLIRMVERKGILQTILADKKKFVLAIVCWIFYFFKYPNNVIREIIVEAELRRIGGLLRKLSPAEISLVKNVANSTFYREWLSAFRGHNLVKFQRGLLVAVLGTIILYVLCPAVSATISPRKQKQQSSEYGTVFLNKASPTVKTDLVKAKQAQEKVQKFCPEKWITVNDNISFNSLPLLSWINQEVFLLWKNRFIKVIDHIPVIDYLVSRLTKTLNQIVEGICFLRLKSGGNNEKGNIFIRGHFVGA